MKVIFSVLTLFGILSSAIGDTGIFPNLHCNSEDYKIYKIIHYNPSQIN